MPNCEHICWNKIIFCMWHAIVWSCFFVFAFCLQLNYVSNFGCDIVCSVYMYKPNAVFKGYVGTLRKDTCWNLIFCFGCGNKWNRRGRRLVDMTDGCFSGGDSQGLPRRIKRFLGYPPSVFNKNSTLKERIFSGAGCTANSPSDMTRNVHRISNANRGCSKFARLLKW